MEFKNIDHWKTTMKKIAKERKLDIQDVQQRYILEEFAQKISASKYKELLVLKGGFIVSTLLGLDTRMTRDLDLTCRTTIYKEDTIKEILLEVINTPHPTFFEYSLDHIRPAQEDDHYSEFVSTIKAKQGKSEIKLKLDISNNTLIYPKALNSSLPSLFNNEPIHLNTYSLENIIAEKFETTLDRGEFNGRMRDLVDIYLLMENNAFMIDSNLLADTIVKVSKERNTLDNLDDFYEIIDSLGNSQIFNSNYVKYLNDQYPSMSLPVSKIFDKFKYIYSLIVKVT